MLGTPPAEVSSLVGRRRELTDVKRLVSTYRLWTIDSPSRSLAWIATRRGEHSRAATLFGAAHTAWDAIGSTPENYAVFARPHDDHLTSARQASHKRAFEAAFTRGQQMSADEAIDFALEAKQSAPAPAAEASEGTLLTSREQEIADLVAQGLSNKAIAATFVISQRTAEAHVEHILTKLSFTSRAQIASWVAGHHAPPGGAT